MCKASAAKQKGVLRLDSKIIISTHIHISYRSTIHFCYTETSASKQIVVNFIGPNHKTNTEFKSYHQEQTALISIKKNLNWYFNSRLDFGILPSTNHQYIIAKDKKVICYVTQVQFLSSNS